MIRAILLQPEGGGKEIIRIGRFPPKGILPDGLISLRISSYPDEYSQLSGIGERCQQSVYFLLSEAFGLVLFEQGVHIVLAELNALILLGQENEQKGHDQEDGTGDRHTGVGAIP